MIHLRQLPRYMLIQYLLHCQGNVNGMVGLKESIYLL